MKARLLYSLLHWIQWTLVVVGAFTFIAAVLYGSPEDRTENSESYAALLAFCAASLTLAVNLDNRKTKWQHIFYGLSWLKAMAAAYLWMVSTVQVDPLSTALPLVLGLLFGVVAVSMTSFLFVLSLFNWQDRRESDHGGKSGPAKR